MDQLTWNEQMLDPRRCPPGFKPLLVQVGLRSNDLGQFSIGDVQLRQISRQLGCGLVDVLKRIEQAEELGWLKDLQRTNGRLVGCLDAPKK